MERRRRGTIATLVVLGAMVAGVLLPPATAAFACSCAMPPPIEVQAEEAELVFVGRQVDRRHVPNGVDLHEWANTVLVIEVSAVYKGDVPATIELLTNRDSAGCGIDLSTHGEVGFTLTPTFDGTVEVGLCSGVGSADALRLTFEPLPPPVGRGPPGFLVGVEAGPVRVAVLDTSGQLLAFGRGPGRLAAAAVCPGGERVVEVVEPDGGWMVGGDDTATLDVRRLNDLTIESSTPIPLTERERSQLNGRGWVFDLDCHDPEASLVSYLLPNGVWEMRAGAQLPGPAAAHVWAGGDLTIVDVGEARTVALDPVAERLYAIVGIDGQRLETRDLTGRLVDGPVLPDGHVGWRLALSDDHTQLAVLARSEPMDRQNWYYAEVDRVVLLDLAGSRTETFALPEAGFAHALHPTVEGFATVTSDWEANRVDLAVVTTDGLRLVARLEGLSFNGEAAIGPDAAVITRHQDHQSSVRVVDGEAVPIEQLPWSRVAVTLLPDTEVELAIVAPPATPTPTPAPTVPTTPTDPAGASGQTANGPATAGDPARTDGPEPSVVAVAIVVVTIVAGVLAATWLVRRRRTANAA